MHMQACTNMHKHLGGGGVDIDGGVEEEQEWEGRWEKKVTSCLKLLVN